MTAAGVATSHCKKVMKLGLSVFRRGFNPSKCKTMAKMTVARIKLLRNKRDAVVKQMRRDIAVLLQSGQDATARIRVEHVIREQNIMAANEFLELFCELVVSRLTIITKQRSCPEDLKEGIASLIFAAPRCPDIPELLAIRDIFEKKYGKDFVSAATDLRPDSGVNRMLIDKLSVRTPSGQVKLKVMKEIAKEHQIDWDTTESEIELLKAPEELIEGPCKFVSATSIPLKPIANQSAEPNKPTSRYSGTTERDNTDFTDTASAAEAAAECAKKAVAAAAAAAILAGKDPNQMPKAPDNNGYNTSKKHESSYSDSTANFVSNGCGIESDDMGDDESDAPMPPILKPQRRRTSDQMETRKVNRRHSYNVRPPRSNIKFDESDCDEEETDMEEHNHPSNEMDTRKVDRRHSYNVPSANDAYPKFDESECDEEESDMEEHAAATAGLPPPTRPAPPVPSASAKHRVHPKLPDYDALAARFEALKSRKS